MSSLAIFSSCKKEDNPSPVNKEETFYIRANINSDTIDYTSGGNKYYYFYGNASEGTVEYIWTVCTAGMSVSGSYEKICLFLGHAGKPSFSSLSNEFFLSLYKKGSVPYSTTDDVENFDGVELEWTDENDIVHWNTIGDQTGSSFDVIKLTEDNPNPNSTNGGASVLVDATFNCKFYSDYYPDSVIVVKNGLLKLRLKNY